MAENRETLGGRGLAHDEPISGSLYAETMRRVPGAVAILATEHDGSRYGITATAICSVSADPAQLMICVNRGSSIVHPLSAVRRLTVNFLAAGQRPVAEMFSRRVERAETRFTVGVWSAAPSGMPSLEGAVAVLDCKVLESTSLATHQALLVRVTDARSNPSVPLLYFSGDYHSLGAPVLQAA